MRRRQGTRESFVQTPPRRIPTPAWNKREESGSLLVCLADANDSCPCPPGFQAGASIKEGKQKATSNYSLCGGPNFHNVRANLVATVLFIPAIIARTTRG